MDTEQQLQNYLRRKALARGVGFDKLESRSRRGFPDVMLYRAGRIVFVELKTPTGRGRLTRLQEKCIDTLRAQGLEVRVISTATGVDWLLDELVQ